MRPKVPEVMLPEDIISRSIALREVVGRRTNGPHGVSPSGQTGSLSSRPRASLGPRARSGKASSSRFAITFEKDRHTGELKLVRKNT